MLVGISEFGTSLEVLTEPEELAQNYEQQGGFSTFEISQDEHKNFDEQLLLNISAEYLSNLMNSVENQNNMNSQLNTRSSEEVMVNHTPSLKRRKACKFCRKSHMQCDGSRPCSRCVKRKISHLCIDEDICKPFECENSKQNNKPCKEQENNLPLASTSTKDFSLNQGEHFTSLTIGQESFLFSHAQKTFPPYRLNCLLAANNTEQMVKKFCNRLNFKLSLLNLASSKSIDSLIIEEFKEGFLWPYEYEKQAEIIETLVKSSFHHAQGPILQLLTFAKDKISVIFKNYPIIEKIRAEEHFERVIFTFDRFFNICTIPSAVWRLFGDMYTFNRSFSCLTGVDCTAENKRGIWSIFYLMTESSCEQYWKIMCSIFSNYPASRQSGFIMRSCQLKNVTNSGQILECNAHFSLICDLIGNPYAVSAIFIPTNSIAEDDFSKLLES
jgi:hypothetical protein